MNVLNRIFGINYRTSLVGIGIIVTAVSRVVIAWRAKDFTALADDGQLIMGTAASLLAGLGLYIAKDANVTGAGALAKAVDSEGKVTNVEGERIGKQPTVVPEVKA
jgi:hypothetical protein